MKPNSKIAIFIILLLSSGLSFKSSAEATVSCPFLPLDGESGRRHIEGLVTSLVVETFTVNGANDIEKLDKLMMQLTDENCALSDGRKTLNFTHAGFEKAFKKIKNKDVILNKLKIIQDEKPDAIYPILAEAHFWIYYAWKARGSGYASTVKPEQWKLFRERLSKAEKILVDNKDRASVSPIWYQLMYVPIFHLKHSQEEKAQYYEEGFKSHKDFLRLYILRRNQLRPRWGGSWEKVDSFIRWSTEYTKDIEGMGMYARLYFGVYDNLRKNENLYDDTPATWEKLKAGLEDLVRIYPNSLFHKNIFALMACEASDQIAYHDIRSKISKSVKWEWSEKYNVSLCDSLLEYPKTNILNESKI